MTTKASTSNQSSVPQATVVVSPNNNEGVLIVDEEALKQALKKANDELRKRKLEQLNIDERELAEIKARHDDDLKALKSQLDNTEATEKLSMDAVHRAAQIARGSAHNEKMAEIRAGHHRERLLHENRMYLLSIQEEKEQTAWVSRFGNKAVDLLKEREEAEARHEVAKRDLREKLELQKQKVQEQYKEKTAQFRRECNESNETHARNLLWGIVFGSIAGFIFDKARL